MTPSPRKVLRQWPFLLFVSYSSLFLSVSQGLAGKSNNIRWERRFPFIRKASTFSDSSSSSSSGSSRFNRKASQYDYIIVGGGTSGCPLAATLSHKSSVLLLERGGVPFYNLNVSWLRNFHLSLADTSSSSAAQTFISTDGVINSRARVLGGASSINAGFYSRPSSRDIRNAGWDALLVNESYPWIEERIVFKPKVAPWQKALKRGLLEIGVSPDNGFTLDHKYGTKVGGTIFDRQGRRHTAADLLISSNPKKLNVLVYATVQRIIFDTSGKRPMAIGVIFKDENGEQRRAYLSRKSRSDVIISCGAIGSPQLLLLSGIGPISHLRKMGISSVLHNKYVGKFLVDNPHNSIFIPSKKPVKHSLIQSVGVPRMGLYIEASSGFGQSSESIQPNHGMMSAEIGQLSTIPPKRRTLEAVQDFLRRKREIPREAFRGGFILEKLARPLSSGQLELISNDVNDNPSVTFNYFSHPRDLRRCVNGVRLLEKVVRSKSFSEFAHTDWKTAEMLLNMSVKANVNLIPKHTEDTTSLEQFCKDTVITIWHYHGGCNVGKVVDHEYRVFGIDGLRVIDGSTLSESPGTNPQATILMLGRYMGLKILRDRIKTGDL